MSEEEELQRIRELLEAEDPVPVKAVMSELGRIGGKVKSAKKARASRANGASGGRPSTRTLIERVLSRKVPPEELKRIQSTVFRHILLRTQAVVTEFFGCEWNEVSHRSWRKMPLHVRQALRQIRAMAKIYAPKFRPKPPKDYVVVRVEKYPGERELWAERHPNMPFVMTRPQKVPISSIFNYAWFDKKFALGVRFDEDDILRNGEGKITREVAVALLKHLEFKYRTPQQ